MLGKQLLELKVIDKPFDAQASFADLSKAK